MKKTVFMAVIAIFAFSSCSNNQNEELNPNNSNAINFSTYTAKQSKGTGISNATFDQFTVYGYSNSNVISWLAQPTGVIMNAATVGRAAGSADNTWFSSPVTWPAAGTHLAFYAYSPVAPSTVYTTPTGSGPQLVYTTDPAASNQNDLVVASSGDITAIAAGTNPRVPLSFTHALSQIGFKAQVANGWTVYINSIEFEGVKTVGTYNFNQDAWSAVGTIGNAAIGLDPIATQGITQSPYINITAKNGYMMLIPQTKSAWTVPGTFNPQTQCRLKIVYSFKNNSDGKFMVGTSPTGFQTAYLPFDLTLNRGRAYSINLNFGDSSSNSGGGGYDENGNPLIDNTNNILFSSTFTEWVYVDDNISM